MCGSSGSLTSTCFLASIAARTVLRSATSQSSSPNASALQGGVWAGGWRVLGAIRGRRGAAASMSAGHWVGIGVGVCGTPIVPSLQRTVETTKELQQVPQRQARDWPRPTLTLSQLRQSRQTGPAPGRWAAGRRRQQTPATLPAPPRPAAAAGTCRQSCPCCGAGVKEGDWVWMVLAAFARSRHRCCR